MTHSWLLWLHTNPPSSLNSAQAQRGTRANVSACLNKPPSATLREAPGRPPAFVLDPNAKHMGAQNNEAQVPLRATKL